MLLNEATLIACFFLSSVTLSTQPAPPPQAKTATRLPSGEILSAAVQQCTSTTHSSAPLNDQNLTSRPPLLHVQKYISLASSKLTVSKPIKPHTAAKGPLWPVAKDMTRAGGVFGLFEMRKPSR